MTLIARTLFASVAFLSVSACAAPSEPDFPLAPHPAPPSPRPLLLAVGGAGEAELELARQLLRGYFAPGGWGGSSLSPDAFTPCASAAQLETCVRDILRPLRAEAGEVAIAVLAAPSPGGGVTLTCLGGARNGQPLNRDEQRVVFTPDEAEDADARVRAEACVGRAFGEYMVP
ncbi:hypothetical protein Q0812_04620 [Brevundimonas sp. 2R-24]|uniref:Lipoprotein n=1 Tax=Peiella sedimenti TaxID=3061083 RepID=A0ABT8SJI0_9CAUL|nr:hypothetical protein [Caulobacteraceae bacterium XZ-24]